MKISFFRPNIEMGNASVTIHHDLNHVEMTGQGFRGFLEETVLHLSASVQPRGILFDNAPVHRCAEDANLPANCQLR